MKNKLIYLLRNVFSKRQKTNGIEPPKPMPIKYNTNVKFNFEVKKNKGKK